MPPDLDHSPLAADDDEVPEQPMVIAWEALDADTYTETLQHLAAWVDWLVNTYEPPTQVIPPCWYAHPAQLEELGHLWTGWQLTRHPLSGVGMIGLDWDTRREHTFQRLRDTVAATGCNARQHNPPTTTVPRTNQNGLQQHLHDDAQTRQATDLTKLRVAAITAVLTDAELRHNHAPNLLRQIAADPAAATDEQRSLAARTLRAAADQAPDRALTAAGARVRMDPQATAESELHQAREALIGALANVAPRAEIASLSDRWTQTLEVVVPAADAIDRAVAAAVARQATAARVASDRLHPARPLRPDPSPNSGD